MQKSCKAALLPHEYAENEPGIAFRAPGRRIFGEPGSVRVASAHPWDSDAAGARHRHTVPGSTAYTRSASTATSGNRRSAAS